MTRLAFPACLLLFATVLCAQAPTPEADAFFARQKWPEAEAAYRKAIASNPADGRAWFRLGGSLHWQNRHADSRAAFEHAVTNGFQVPYAQALIGREYTEDHDLIHAREYLDKAATSGFALVTVLDTDAGFATARNEPWFGALHSRVDLNSKPCMANPAFRQFDFWVGEWDVEAGGTKVAHSSIQNLADGCAILENWMPLAGPQGKSWNVLNQVTGKWEQTWMSAGNLAKLEGEFKEGAMRFTSVPGTSAPGTQTRMSFTPNSDGGIGNCGSVHPTKANRGQHSSTEFIAVVNNRLEQIKNPSHCNTIRWGKSGALFDYVPPKAHNHVHSSLAPACCRRGQVVSTSNDSPSTVANGQPSCTARKVLIIKVII